MFKNINLNPSGKKACDCVVRAIAYATEQSWSKVYKDLCDIGLELYDVPTSKKVYQKYLEVLGFEKMPMPKKQSGPTYERYKVNDFAETFPKDYVYVISVAHHLTVVSYGDIVDTWNCGYKSVGNYWRKKN